MPVDRRIYTGHLLKIPVNQHSLMKMVGGPVKLVKKHERDKIASASHPGDLHPKHVTYIQNTVKSKDLKTFSYEEDVSFLCILLLS